MANSNGRIYINPPYGVEIADLQQVLGRSVGDLGLLCSDQEWYLDHIDPVTQEPVYLLRPVNRIKPMAKYKPVRYPKLGILTVAERASTRFGFGDGLVPTLDLTQDIPQNDWVYLRPRGAEYNEWFRLRDFEGYSHGACAPLAIMAGGLVYDGESQILIFGDGFSNAIRGDGYRWEPDESLSITELIQSGSSLYDYYISFLLIDKTDHEKNLIVTDTTMSGLVNSGHSHGIFKIFAQGATEGGLTYPAVPLLSQARSGNSFDVIACLMPGYNPASGSAYAVYTQSDTPGFLGLLPYSLGFETGCDRTETALDSGAFKMDGTRITGWDVIVTDTAMEQTVSGQVFRAYSLEIRATFSTEDAAAYYGEMGISGTLTFNTSGAIGPTVDQAASLPAQGVAVSLVGKTAGQNKLLWSSSGVNYMWIPKVNGSVVRTQLILSADFYYPFSSGLHTTGTHTAYIPN